MKDKTRLQLQIELYAGYIWSYQRGDFDDEQIRLLNRDIASEFGKAGLSRIKRSAWKLLGVMRESRNQRIVRRFHERASVIGLARGYGLTRLQVEEIIRRDLRRTMKKRARA